MVNAETKNKLQSNTARSQELSKSLGVAVQGSWTNLAAHVIYMLLDAPNAHVITQWCNELKILDWSRAEINPLITSQEAMKQLQ
jgi:hypothetical protein